MPITNPTAHPTDRIDRIKACASGRWREIFVRLGMPETHFLRPNKSCPLCGGRDRFTFFANEADGGWLCRRCGHGDGIELVRRFCSASFPQTLEKLETVLGLPHPNERYSRRRFDLKSARQAEEARLAALAEVWERAQRLCVPVAHTETNPALRYLKSRGLGECDRSTELRWLADEPYWETDEKTGRPVKGASYPVMLARATDEAGRLVALHRTYLTAAGEKAPVSAAKKMSAGAMGNALVRLFPASNLLCLSEGIETALSVHMLTGLPAWSVISLSGFKRFDAVPVGLEKLLIYGDNDASFSGAAGAYELATRLRAKYPHLAVEVRIPTRVGEDWNDVWQRERLSLGR